MNGPSKHRIGATGLANGIGPDEDDEQLEIELTGK